MCGELNLLEPALRWVPFVTHWKLLAVLWLQLPFFRTATRLLSHIVPPMLSHVLRTPAGGQALAERVADASRPNAVYSEGLVERRVASSTSTGATGG